MACRLVRHLAVLVLSFFITACAFESTVSPLASEEHLSERKRLEKEPLHLGKGAHRLVVKFDDALKIRTSQGVLEWGRNPAPSPLALLVESHELRFQPLLGLPDSAIEKLEERAATLSRTSQPDLRSIFAVEMRDASNERLLNVARALEKLDEIEYVYLESLGVEPPQDVAPVTPNFVASQTYRGRRIGMDVNGAWVRGAKGKNVRLSDCEYGWNTNHEDLAGISIHPEPDQTPHPDVYTIDWDEHGTAVAGVAAALVNEYGVSGIVPEADIYTFPEWTIEGGFRRASAIAAAVAQSEPGDVVLLEMQADGPGGYVPAEYDPTVWIIVKNAVDQGVIVVAAAGNGGVHLDSPAMQTYLQRGDSGAIIVGAGSPNANHERLWISSYGNRVDVHGWGRGVITTGYGDFATVGGDVNQRYTRFAGTSSASAMVASAVVAIQSFAKANLGKVLTPAEMRALLKSTGTPQGNPHTGNIGPLPNIRAALDALAGTGRKPTVELTNPLENAIIRGWRTVTAEAADTDGTIVKVIFTMPDNTVYEDSEAPYTVYWDSYAVANGHYSIRVVAINDVGGQAEDSISIEVANRP